MVRFLELAWDAIRNSVTQLTEWLSGLAAAGTFSPGTWSQSTWLVLALVVLTLALILLVRRRRRNAARRLPEMMISHGEIALLDRSEASAEELYDMAAPAQASHRLTLTLSNLNPWPVQLLELAVRTRGIRQPVVAEAGSVVPPNGAVDVVADLYDLPGDVGVVELFLYSTRGGRHTFKMSTPLEWEPWDARFRVRALSSRVTPTTRLASQEKRRHERRSYRFAKRRQRQKELAEATWRRAEEITRGLKERRASAADKPVAAFAGERVAADPGGERERGAVSAGWGAPLAEPQERPAQERTPQERTSPESPPPEPAPVEAPEPAPAAAEPRRRLDFPDEF